MGNFREALLAARTEYGAIPEHRRDELERRFDTARRAAREHASYTRRASDGDS